MVPLAINLLQIHSILLKTAEKWELYLIVTDRLSGSGR